MNKILVEWKYWDTQKRDAYRINRKIRQSVVTAIGSGGSGGSVSGTKTSAPTSGAGGNKIPVTVGGGGGGIEPPVEVKSGLAWWLPDMDKVENGIRYIVIVIDGKHPHCVSMDDSKWLIKIRDDNGTYDIPESELIIYELEKDFDEEDSC